MPRTDEEKIVTRNGVNMSRLCRAMEASSRSLAPFRRNRAADIRSYVGSNYGENGAAGKMLVNGLWQYVQVVGNQLIGQQPRFMLSTMSMKAKPTVAIEQQWVNEQVDKIDLQDVLQEGVVDAIFSLGITKVALSSPADAATSGWQLPAGEPFVANVDLDDFVYDIHASRFKEAQFIGHRYRMPFDIARDWREFNSKARKELTASEDPEYTPEGDERVRWMSRNEEGDQEEFEDMVDLWEVYLPRYGLIVTLEHDRVLTGDSDAKEPLRVQEWVGPPEGPYHFLGLGVVPSNAMPTSPIQHIKDLNSLLNNVWRKIDDDCRNWKTVTAVRGQADADGKRIIEANHGEGIKVDDPESAREITFRGLNPVMFNFVLQARNTWNMQAGNLDLLAGTAPQSRTATQDKMLNENAGAMLSAIQSRVTRWVSEIGKALVWYYHHDPFRMMETEYRRPNLPEQYTITRRVMPEERVEIEWDQLGIKVDPYTLPYSSPAQQLGAMNAVVQQVLPMLPMLQQQGGAFDIQFYLRKIAEYTAQPDLEQLFKLHEPEKMEPAGEGEMPHMLQGNTQREYLHRGAGDNSPAAQQAEAINMTSPEFGQND